jgi:FkbM family methyltransferase
MIPETAGGGAGASESPRHEPRWARLALPLARLELPGKTRILKAVGVFDDALWTDAGFRKARMRWHGAVVDLNTAERFERWAYFLGRYHEWPLQLLMRTCLRPGEVFVDVGANIGLISLLAAWIVGERGRVFAYEPNPVVFSRLKAHVEENAVGNIRLCPEALGERNASATLSVIGLNTGSGTLGLVPPGLATDVQYRVGVPVVRGDDAAAAWECQGSRSTPLMIKIDAEGFETAIVRGLGATLETRRPLLVMEVNPQALGMNRTSPRELRAELCKRGYVGRTLDCVRKWARWRPDLRPLPDLPVRQLHDEVWAHPDGPHWERIRRFRTD